MTDTNSIFPIPEIKCYAGDNKLCNTLSHTTVKTESASIEGGFIDRSY